MDAWTDERLDDLAASLRPLPAEMARHSAELARQSADLGRVSQLVERNTEELRAIGHDLSALHRLLAQIGWGLGFAVLAALIGLLGFAA